MSDGNALATADLSAAKVGTKETFTMPPPAMLSFTLTRNECTEWAMILSDSSSIPWPWKRVGKRAASKPLSRENVEICAARSTLKCWVHPTLARKGSI